MLYCGIDVHKKSSVVHILDENCKNVRKATIDTSPSAYLEFFREYEGRVKVSLNSSGDSSLNY